MASALSPSTFRRRGPAVRAVGVLLFLSGFGGWALVGPVHAVKGGDAGHAPSPGNRQAPSSQDTPRNYDVRRTPLPVVTDGDLSEAAWEGAPWTEDFVDILGTEGPIPPLRTRAKLLWDDEYLYVGAELEEPDLWATLLERDAIVYQDDDFEVFLDPDGDGLAYYEIEINALGTEFDLFLDRPYRDGGRAHIGWDLPGLRTGVWLHGTLNDPSDRDEGWGVELAIPWRDLVPPGSSEVPGTPPRPGDVWRINFSRVDWPLEVEGGRYRKAILPSPDHPHPEANWVWSPQGEVDMHLPGHWGRVRFVPSPPPSRGLTPSFIVPPAGPRHSGLGPAE